jgi:hypothetical protein
MTFSYIFNGQVHWDASVDYMAHLGMDAEQVESVLSQRDFELRQNSERRAAAYRSESDPLFFKAQRGEVDQQVWLDKVEEIKQRFPTDG